MSVPPELMKLVAGGAGKGGPAPQMLGAPGGAMPPGPGAAPMSTPQPAHGEKENAMVNVNLAMDLLEQTLPALGSESEEGQAVLKCLSGLSQKFGHSRAKTQELMPAELMQLMSSLPQTGGMGHNPAQIPPQMPGQPPQGA